MAVPEWVDQWFYYDEGDDMGLSQFRLDARVFPYADQELGCTVSEEGRVDVTILKKRGDSPGVPQLKLTDAQGVEHIEEWVHAMRLMGEIE